MEYLYIIRNATVEDVSFIADTILAAEKGSSDKLSLSTFFDLKEEEVKNLVIAMLEEEIDGCEFSISSYKIVEWAGKAVGAFGGWTECGDGNLPSRTLRANLIGYTFPRPSLDYLRSKAEILEGVMGERKPNSFQIEYMYVSPEHIGMGLDLMLLKAQEEKAIQSSQSISIIQAHLFTNSIFAIKLLMKNGYKITERHISEHPELLDYLPCRERVIMEKQLS